MRIRRCAPKRALRLGVILTVCPTGPFDALVVTPEDLHVDTPPFTNVHLRTTLGEYVTTSLALVIEKSAKP